MAAYVGRALTMTQEQTEEQRRMVPDHPKPLPANALACEWCGIAVPNGQPVTSLDQRQPMPGGRVQEAPPLRLARCEDCARLHTEALGVVKDHPSLAARHGSLAVEQVMRALAALDLIGRPMVGTVPASVTALQRHRLAWPAALNPQRCNPWRWAHVGMTQRAEVRQTYARLLRQQIGVVERPKALRHPTGSGCLLCGIGQAMAWIPRTTTPSALGGRGPGLVKGYLCPTCDGVVESEGAMGQTAICNALIAYVRRTKRESAADVLKMRLSDDLAPVLPAWGSRLDRKPNTAPFDHLWKVIRSL